MDELRKAAQALVDSMDDVDTYRPFLGTSQHIALADLRDSLAKSVAAPSKAKPVAVAHMGGMEHGPVEIRVTPYGFDTLRNGRTNLYTLSALKAKNASAAPQDQDAKWYCKDCRATGLLHCSDPEHCGGMKLVSTQPQDQDAKLDEIRKTLKIGMNIGKALREGINEDIAKDAARYRFMQGNESIKFWDGLGALHPSEWDEFIDAAMKEQKP